MSLAQCETQQFFCRVTVFGLGGGFADELIGFGGFVAEGDEAGHGILEAAGSLCRGVACAGHVPACFRPGKDFIAQFNDESFSGFFTDAGALGEEGYIGVGDGTTQKLDGHTAEDGDTDFWADSGDPFNE